MRKALQQHLRHLFVRFMVRCSTCKPYLSDDGVSREFHCFNFSGGLQFGVFRGSNLMHFGSWWAVRLLLNEGGELIDCRFWRNVMEPGDVRITGKKLQKAVAAWMEYRDPLTVIGVR